MKFVAFCLIFLAVAFASKEGVQPSIGSFGGLTMAEVQQIEELRQTKWGNIYITMAELQVSVGPIQRLIQALEDTVKELTQSENAEKNRFNQKKAAHESQVTTLKSQIANAESEINNNKAKITNVLIPRKKQAESDINTATVTIGKKKDDIAKSIKKREVEHAEFLKKVEDHTNAIGAADESIALTSTLQKNKPSLVEIKKTALSIRKFELQLRQTHFTETPLIEALITLVTSQNFANQDSINKVLSMLSDFRKKLVASLDLERTNEAQNQAAHDAHLIQINKEIEQLQTDIKRNSQLIVETQKAIDDSQNIIMVKTHEVLTLKEKLTAENEQWRKEVVIHKELMAEIHKEITVITECKALFSKHNFSAYVTGKMGK